MHFDLRLFKVPLLLVPLILHLGCMPKFGEEPPPPLEQKISGVDCLGPAFESMDKFFVGKASEQEIRVSFACMDGVLDKFVKLVRGKTKGQYEPQELADFIEGQFFSNSPSLTGKSLSPELQREIMKVKRVFMGGSLEVLTIDEVQKLRDILRQTGNLVQDLNFAMKILSLNWNPDREFSFQQTDDLFERANLAFQTFIIGFTQMMVGRGVSYEWQDLYRLFYEFDRFYGKDWQFVSEIQRYLPVAAKLKKALNGGDENVILSAEWKGVALLGGRGYTQYLRYFYFLRVTESGESSIAARIPYFARTFQDILSMFGQLIDIKPSAQLNVQELRELGQSISKAWPNLRISEEFIRQLMKMKVTIFGGSLESWTSKDFAQGEMKVQILKEAIQDLIPYYEIYGLDWDPEESDLSQNLEKLAVAEKALVQNLPYLSRVFDKELNLREVLEFIVELEKIYRRSLSKEQLVSHQFKTYLPLFEKVKSKMFRDSGYVILTQQWTNLGKTVGEGYGVFLHYFYFLQNKNPLQASSASSFVAFQPRLISFLENFVSRFPRREVSKRDLKEILVHIQESKLLPSFSQSSLERGLGFLLEQLLVTPEDRLSGKTISSSLNLNKIRLLNQELSVWLLPMNSLLAQRSSNKSWSYEAYRNWIRRKTQSSSSTAHEKVGLRELELLSRKPNFLRLDSLGRAQVFHGLESAGINVDTLSGMNLSRFLSRSLLRSFGKDLSRIQSYQGLNQDEVSEAVDFIRPLLKELGFTTELSPQFVTSRFFEANIFTPHADGNTLISFAETSELLTLIFSGLKNRDIFRQDFDSYCSTSQATEEDPVDYQCLLNVSYGNLNRLAPGLPHLHAYRDRVSPATFGRFYYDVLRAAAKAPTKNLKTTLGDVSLVPHLLQYIELTFVKFDRNQDDLIDYREAEQTFPVFEGLLLDLTKGQIDQGLLSRDEMFPLFCYLLYHGEAPGVLSYLTKWIPWKNNPSSWRKVLVDRTQVASILAMIQSMMTERSAESSH